MLLLILAATKLHAQPQPALREGVPIGPGVGGQVHAFAFDPLDTNVAYAGGDVCGVYRYTYDAGGGQWEPWSAGLGFRDINKAFYVEDIIVIRDKPNRPDIVRDDWEGVYAATQGGLYFRRNDASSWQHVEAELSYTGGQACGVFGAGPDCALQVQKIPFCSVAYDSIAGTLYLGAGTAVYGGKANFYPHTNDPQAPSAAEFSLWKLDLTVGSVRRVSPLQYGATPPAEGYGYARQVAVLHYNDTDPGGTPHTAVIAACESKILKYDINLASGSTSFSTIWSEVVGNKSAASQDFSTLPWAVAVGSAGRIYAAMQRRPYPVPGEPDLRPGIWTCQAPDFTDWDEVPESGGTLWTQANPAVNWVEFLRDTPTGAPKRHLTQLSVVPHPGGQDEIFVGIGRVADSLFGQCGYLRYGNFDNGAGIVTGWAFIHQNVGDAIYLTDWVANSSNETIHAHLMEERDMGWHKHFPRLEALTPFAVHPAKPNIMAGVDYHIPMMTRDAGDTWFNLYTEGPSDNGPWRNKGLNLLCTRSAAMTGDGRLVIGAADYGVFVGVDSGNLDYRMLRPAGAAATIVPHPDAVDVAVARVDDGDEYYMVNEYIDPGNSPPGRCAGIYVWRETASSTPADWVEVSGGLAGAIEAGSTELYQITAIELLDESTMVVAAGRLIMGEWQYYLCKGTRQPGASGWSNSWTWSKVRDIGVDLITAICRVPGRSEFLYGRKFKYGGVGGVRCVDYTSQGWLTETTLFDKTSANALLRDFASCVTAIEVDSGGSVAYVGTSRHDSAWAPARGGVLKCVRIGPGQWTCEILAGGDAWHFPLEGRADYPPAGSGAIEGWRWCANVTGIAVSAADPSCFFAAVNNGSYHDDQTGVWYYNGYDGTWDHVWGGGESGAGAVTVDIHPEVPNRLYIGSVGQEFFAVDFESSPRPVIAGSAEYPLLANATGLAHAFAVRFTSACPIDSAFVDLSSIGGPVLDLTDATGGEDALAGDGVFTTVGRFAATLALGQTYSGAVYAVAQDGRYSRRNVAIEVVGGTARFVDKSEFAGDLVGMLPASADTLPYAAIYFNTVTDGAGLDAMIVTIDDNATAPLMMENTGASNGAPVFRDRSLGGEVAWLEESLPSGSRGICSTDYDRSDPDASAGNTDFFICNPTSGGQIYRGTVVGGQPRFVAMEGILAGQDAVAGAVTAQWGDYNRDGFDDLAIATANYTQPVKSISGGGPFSSGLKILRNVGGARFDQSVNSYSMGPNICLSMAWVNLDQGTPGDRGLDLVTWNYLDTGTVFWENLGHNELVNDTYVAPGYWPINDQWRGGMSVNDLDFDHDGDRDLLVTEARGFRRAMVLRNNLNPVGGVATGTKSFDTFSLAHDRDWTGAVVGSFDTQRDEDVLLLPSEGQPALFMNVGPQAPGTYRDLAFTLGLRGGATSGALAADFDGAGSTDLFLGRTRTDEFLYSNVGPDGTQALQRSLRVNLGTAGSSGRALLGAVVAVTADGVTHTKVVNAGAGRGGQAPRDVLFTLGDFAGSSVTVTVTYPSREVDSFPVTLNGPLTTVTAIENQTVVIKAGTRADPEPDFSYHLDPGHMEWIFRWRTEGVRGDITRDVVHVENVNYDENDDCYLGIPLGATRDLKFGAPDVVHNVYWDGSNWQHEVRWTGLPCATGCIYRFTVSSGIGASVTSSQPPKSTTPTSYCIPDDVNPGQ
jgi:hypothetical protein